MLIPVQSVEFVENVAFVVRGERVCALPASLPAGVRVRSMSYDTDLRELRVRLEGEDQEHWFPQSNIRHRVVSADDAAAWDGRNRMGKR